MAPVSGGLGEISFSAEKNRREGQENELYSDKNKMLTWKRYFEIRGKRFIKIG
jgi:hypothetical protein